MNARLTRAVALTAAAATPFAVAAFAAWSMGPVADGSRDIPAAVVNLDEMLTTTGEDGSEQVMFAGRQVVTDLVGDEEDGIDFRILNADDAAEALADGSVHAIVTIPEDFSRRVTSLQGDDPQQAGIRIVTDASSDGLATRLATETGESIVASFGDLVTTQFVSGIYGGMGTLAEQLGEAADGATELANGGDELSSGLGDLAGGIDQLADGASGAQDGARQLADGGAQLADGLGTAHAGIGQLSDGAAELSDGVGAYTSGVDELAGGAASLSDGVAQYTAGADQLAAAIQQAADRIDAGLADAAASGGLGELEAALDQSADAASGLAAALAANPTTDPAALSAAQQLAGGLDQLGAQDLSGSLTASLGEVSAGVGQLEAGAQQLAAGSQPLRDGASSLAAGAAQLADGSGPLRDGAAQLSGGLSELDGSFGQSVTGAEQLASGAGELSTGLGELESGAVQLAAGARSAETGATQLGEGARSLGDGLREGVAQLPQLTEDELADLSDVVANPVGFDLEERHGVSGAARVAALAVPIGLWLGALALALVLRPRLRALVQAAVTPGRALWTTLVRSSWVVGVQAVLAMLVVHAIGGVEWTAAPATLGVSLLFGAVATLLHVAFVAWWGSAGAIVSIVLLALQAVAAGGIVPRDVLGEGFASVAPILPLTHAVDALQAIAAGRGGAGTAIVVLVLFLVVAGLAAALAVQRARSRATGERLRALTALEPAPRIA